LEDLHMTLDEIVAGLEYRLDNLQAVRDTLIEENQLNGLIEDYEVRIDEIDSVLTWIKENSQ